MPHKNTKSFLRVVESDACREQTSPSLNSVMSNFASHQFQMITPEQLRAARGLLDWTRTELAKAANLSPETIKNVEHGTFRPSEPTCESLLHTFARHNVEFLNLPFLNVRGAVLVTPKSPLDPEAKKAEECQS